MTPGIEEPPVAAKGRSLTLPLLSLGLVLVYAPILARLVQQWYSDGDMGHGFFVPLVAGYIVWLKRESLRQIPLEPCWWGLPLMVLGLLQGLAGLLGAELFLSRTAFLESLVGLLLFLGGRRLTRTLAFPLLVLCFMVPIPAILYTRITFPLQLLASRVAEAALYALQIPVLRNGNVLELPERTLSVVEACSGIRSLLALGFLSAVYGYFFESRNWMRLVLVGSAVPIAIIANAGRVTVTGILAEYRPELAEGFFHSAEGWVIFMLALAMLAVLHSLLRKIVA